MPHGRWSTLLFHEEKPFFSRPAVYPGIPFFRREKAYGRFQSKPARLTRCTKRAAQELSGAGAAFPSFLNRVAFICERLDRRAERNAEPLRGCRALCPGVRAQRGARRYLPGSSVLVGVTSPPHRRVACESGRDPSSGDARARFRWCETESFEGPGRTATWASEPGLHPGTTPWEDPGAGLRLPPEPLPVGARPAAASADPLPPLPCSASRPVPLSPEAAAALSSPRR